MGYRMDVYTLGKKYSFDDVFAHAIGNSGALQVKEMDGNTVVFGSFERVQVHLTEEEKAAWKRQIEEAQALAEAKHAMEEAQKQELALHVPPVKEDGGADLETDEVDSGEYDYDDDDEPATAEDYDGLADDAESVAEEARAIAAEMRAEKAEEVKH